MSGDHDGAIQIHWLVYLFPWWHQNQHVYLMWRVTLCSGLAALSLSLGGTLKKPKKKGNNTHKDFLLVECDWLAIWVSGVGLNVCECAGKEESHPGARVSSHSCLAKVL